MWIPKLKRPPNYVKNIRLVSCLPCLPVPELNETLERLLQSAKPFLNQSELCEAESIVQRFSCPGGEGEYLQCKLKERANEKENWLNDWWQHWAYLDNRSSLVTLTSVGICFPFKKFDSNHEVLGYAAKIIASALEFKSMEDENKITRESCGDDPLDMSQYKQVFGSTRIPCSPQDYVISKTDSDYIIVLYRNILYKVGVKEGRSWMKQFAILEQLKEIVLEKCIGCPIGLLTADCRNEWNTAYDHLRQDPVNCKTLNVIEGSLFVLCLDLEVPPNSVNTATTTMSQCVHGGGPNINGANRWFDKTIQFIVGQCGAAGVCYEPSVAEVDVMIGIMDYINSRMSTPMGRIPTCEKPETLFLNLDQNSMRNVCCAESRFESFVNDFELFCFKFTACGKDVLRYLGFSPDSFVQIAIQLTYFKMTGELAPQFEIVSTRKFKGGRNEAIRSCSEDTVSFLKAFCDPLLSARDKLKCLFSAVNTHINLVTKAMNGQGIDRHLFGLKMAACENKMFEPRIFSHSVYKKTSLAQLYTFPMKCKFDGYMACGPMLHDGYACFYNIRPEYINFSITARVSSSSTNASLFAGTLNEVREDEPAESQSPPLGPDETEVTQLLNQGNSLEALKVVLRNAPLGS